MLFSPKIRANVRNVLMKFTSMIIVLSVIAMISGAFFTSTLMDKAAEQGAQINNPNGTKIGIYLGVIILSAFYMFIAYELWTCPDAKKYLAQNTNYYGPPQTMGGFYGGKKKKNYDNEF